MVKKAQHQSILKTLRPGSEIIWKSPVKRICFTRWLREDAGT